MAHKEWATQAALRGSPSYDPLVLEVLDFVMLVIFTLEAAIKIVAEGPNPSLYFNDAWNACVLTSPRTVDRPILLLLSRRDRLDDARPPSRVACLGLGGGKE